MPAGGSIRRGNSPWASAPEPPRRRVTADSTLRRIEWALNGLIVLVLTVTVGLPMWTDAANQTPTLTLSPSSGSVGTLVTASGSNFGHTTVQLTWDGSGAGMPLITVGGNGSFRTTFTVSPSSAGTHEVQAAAVSVTVSGASLGVINGNKKSGTGSVTSVPFLVATAVAPTPAATATPGPTATATPGPTATATPGPTATPASTVAPTPTPTASASPSPSVSVACTGLQTLIDAAAGGSTVTVPACVYREQVQISKALNLVAAAGAELRGSDVWTSWTASGTTWISAQTVPAFPAHGMCLSGTSRCLWPEQVFIDGTAQYQVAPLTVPGPGQFSLDGSRRVVLGSNPTGHLVEVTVRQNWVIVSAGGVAISGFRMRHASADAQDGGIRVGADSATISGNVLSDAHGQIISLNSNHLTRVLNNDIFRGGQLGVGISGGSDVLIQGNRIHDNNTEGFADGWEAGGLKSCFTNRLTMDQNEVYSNGGPGLWSDCNELDLVFSNNRVHHNLTSGIFAETAYGVKIFGNAVWENSWGYTGWGGGGIVSASSGALEISNNVVAWNADGIAVSSQNRADAEPTTNIWVHDNAVILAPQSSDASEKILVGWVQDWSGTLYAAASNNKGSLNRYWQTQPDPSWCRFAWNGCISSLSSFNVTPGEEGATYMSDADRNTALSAVGIPLTPETH